jgi:hypothetical protein
MLFLFHCFFNEINKPPQIIPICMIAEIYDNVFTSSSWVILIKYVRRTILGLIRKFRITHNTKNTNIPLICIIVLNPSLNSFLKDFFSSVFAFWVFLTEGIEIIIVSIMAKIKVTTSIQNIVETFVD